MGLELLLPISTGILSLGIAWGIITSKVTDLKEEHVRILRQLEKLWEYKDEHGKEAEENRIGIMKEIGRIDAQFALKDGQYNEILRRLSDITVNVAEIKSDVSILKRADE